MGIATLSFIINISQVVGDDTRQSLSFIDKAYAY